MFFQLHILIENEKETNILTQATKYTMKNCMLV